MTELTQNSNAISDRTNNSVIISIFETFRSNIFITKSIREILFGLKGQSPVDQITQYLPQLSRLGIKTPKTLPDDYSLFLNNSENKFEVFTGHKTGLMARILKWNDKTWQKLSKCCEMKLISVFIANRALDVWTGRSCNQINGTNGFRYSPFIDKSDRLFDYSTDMCRYCIWAFSVCPIDISMFRSIEMSYEDFYQVDGIPVYRFSPVDNIFYSLHHNVKNKCFCLTPQKPEKCNFIGILDLYSCSSGAPLILSNPHFRRSSEVIAKSVVGLSPEERLHQTFVEIEPVIEISYLTVAVNHFSVISTQITGLVMQRTQRYQYNVHVKKCPLNPWVLGKDCDCD